MSTLGWIAATLVLLSMWAFAERKYAAGFWLNIFGSLGWLIVGLTAWMPPLIGLNIAILAIDVRGLCILRRQHWFDVREHGYDPLSEVDFNLGGENDEHRA